MIQFPKINSYKKVLFEKLDDVNIEKYILSGIDDNNNKHILDECLPSDIKLTECSVETFFLGNYVIVINENFYIDLEYKLKVYINDKLVEEYKYIYDEDKKCIKFSNVILNYYDNIKIEAYKKVGEFNITKYNYKNYIVEPVTLNKKIYCSHNIS